MSSEELGYEKSAAQLKAREQQFKEPVFKTDADMLAAEIQAQKKTLGKSDSQILAEELKAQEQTLGLLDQKKGDDEEVKVSENTPESKNYETKNFQSTIQTENSAFSLAKGEGLNLISN